MTRAHIGGSSRNRWLTCRPLPGLTYVRSPFRPARSRALPSEARGRLETAAALRSLGPDLAFVNEWVNPDCRGVPHVLEIVITSGLERRYLHIHKAADKLELAELQRCLEANPVEGQTLLTSSPAVAPRGPSA